MSVFVFQSVRDRYDLERKIVVGAQDTWYATRYRNQMTPGSAVFLWMAGEESWRGLYGWGRLISAPYLKPTWEAYGVDLIYDERFRQPILAKTFRDDRELSQMLILRAPQATNFLLSDTEAERLVDLVRERQERPPNLADF